MSKKIINLLIAVTLTLGVMGCNKAPKTSTEDMNSAEIKTNFARNEYASPSNESTTLAPISEPNSN